MAFTRKERKDAELMKVIADFHEIILNYIKMDRLLKETERDNP